MIEIERPIKATYYVETSYSVRKAAETLAGEQSSGTFIAVPGETDELKEKYGAKVEHIEELETVRQPSLPGAKQLPESQNTYKRAIIRIAWPFENIGVNLPVLLSTIAGNVYDLGLFSGIKLLDVELPQQYATVYKGPQFGIRGTRDLIGVYDRPLIGSIIKPCIGLTPEETADRVKTLVEAGIDFIKDDEVLSDAPVSPFEKRVKKVMEVIHAYADDSGKQCMYAFNISGNLDEMRRKHDIVLKHKGTAVMANVLSIGFTGLAALREFSELPIHGHRCGFGALHRHELLGMSFIAYHKFWRILGIDHIHTNGLKNKFYESDDSVVASIRACYKPLFGGYRCLPVLGSGQWAGQVEETYKRIRSVDVLYLCGGGILAHPGGISAGVKSVQQAWQAVKEGKSVKEAAKEQKELKEALDFFGK
jgi:ribulose-bisphosphate carboxylase large chain